MNHDRVKQYYRIYRFRIGHCRIQERRLAGLSFAPIAAIPHQVSDSMVGLAGANDAVLSVNNMRMTRTADKLM
jgi:hypothetical protein